MSDKIKEVLETPEVPEELRPENIPDFLGNAPDKRRKRIRRTAAWCSAIAACAVVVTGSVILNRTKNFSANEMTAATESVQSIQTKGDTDTDDDVNENDEISHGSVSESSELPEKLAFVPADSYSSIYSVMSSPYNRNCSFGDDETTAAVAEESASDAFLTNDGTAGDESSSQYKGETETDVYDTIEQVEGIDEADIIKANSTGVYYVTGNTASYIPFNSETGKFGEQHIIDIRNDSEASENGWMCVYDMYLTDDILTVITGTDYENGDSWYDVTAVLTYDVSAGTPEFSGRGVQSGYYSSSRMKDGILYLVTNQYPNFWYIFDEENYMDYIPFYGESAESAECLDPSCIYLPRDTENELIAEYVNISGIDIKNPGKPVSEVSVAGWTGEIYCSGQNLYITQVKYDSGWISADTVFTRFSLDNGVVSPEASGSVNGLILNQFSMDEYNGYFRAATTSWTELNGDDEWGMTTENNLFVLDMNMNTVGSVTGFAEDESVKSVNFNGDTAYVVTYEQTDPLFAIDLSDPVNPFITDEFKINGYSSFIRKWNDDLLLGFGVDATDEAIEVGVKLVMFDVSDDGDLKECGIWSMSGDSYHDVYSEAVYDRKALLLSPQRNLIGFPVSELNEDDNKWNYESSYRLFSYEDGQFKELAIIYGESEYESFRRAVYIGDYLCVFSDTEAISENLITMTETDRIKIESKEYEYGYGYTYYD